jgi:hypothetical protein
LNRAYKHTKLCIHHRFIPIVFYSTTLLPASNKLNIIQAGIVCYLLCKKVTNTIIPCQTKPLIFNFSPKTVSKNHWQTCAYISDFGKKNQTFHTYGAEALKRIAAQFTEKYVWALNNNTLVRAEL